MHSNDLSAYTLNNTKVQESQITDFSIDTFFKKEI